MTHEDSANYGDAYFLTIRHYEDQLTPTAQKVLLRIGTMVTVKSYQFKVYSLPYRQYFCYTTLTLGLNELTTKGYLQRVKRGFYLLTPLGLSFLSGFWMLHGKAVTKLSAAKTLPK
jgi:hypothetical protein